MKRCRATAIYIGTARRTVAIVMRLTGIVCRGCRSNTCRTVIAALVLANVASADAGNTRPAFKFAPVFFVGMSFQANIVDINGDGWLEPFGLVRAGAGVLTTQISQSGASSVGLGKIYSIPDNLKTLRVVDVNGDGLLDIITDSYSCPGTAAHAMLFINNGDGSYTEDPAFSSLNIGGHGESIVVADFDNDGYVDIFIPRYTSDYPGHGPCSTSPTTPAPASTAVLLKNMGPFSVGDGKAHFIDVTPPAMKLLDLKDNPEVTAEGAQALDINDDGLIDLYTGGHLFINHGGMSFTDESYTVGLPWCAVVTPSGAPNCVSPNGTPATDEELISFDEGLQWFDWNNDGLLDLAYLHPTLGLSLFQQSRTQCGEKPDSIVCIKFTQRNDVIQASTTSSCGRDGMKIADFDGDGREEIFVGGGNCDSAIILWNSGTSFVGGSTQGLDGFGNSNGVATGDLTSDGKLDLVLSMAGQVAVLTNETVFSPASGSFVIEVVGPLGEHNQQGRVVRVSPPGGVQVFGGYLACPGGVSVCYTRVVDGGSGYLGMSQYPILIGTGTPGPHTAQIQLPVYDGGSSFNSDPLTTTVTFNINPGQYVRVYAPTPAAAVKVVLCHDSGPGLALDWEGSQCPNTPVPNTQYAGRFANPFAPTASLISGGAALPTSTAGGGGASDWMLLTILALLIPHRFKRPRTDIGIGFQGSRNR
jgi:hypothetical protein